MTTLLSVQSVGIDTAFGPLLAEVSFSLKKGDRIGLIGHNGCGKSTLLKILSGDLPASTGTVYAILSGGSHAERVVSPEREPVWPSPSRVISGLLKLEAISRALRYGVTGS